ncbi:MAG: hypothetical protein ACWGON_07785, partial [Gemmatimonadota bacterium]
MKDRGWTLARAALLVMAAGLLSPISPVWIVFVPFALLLLAFRTDDWMSVALAAVVLGVGFAGSSPGGMEWYVPRAWSLIVGGSFVAVSVVRGGRGWVDRSLGAVGLAVGGVMLIGLARPGVVQGVNWWMVGEIRQAALVAGGILEQLQGGADPEVRRQVSEAVRRWLSFQEDVYPALLLLATIASLGLAWFGFERISGRVRSPGPVRGFRFSDHL